MDERKTDLCDAGFRHGMFFACARRVKRALSGWMSRVAAKREARRAFGFDRARFMDNAGLLHLDRREAARASVIMGYHVLEKGLTMPCRRAGFGVGKADQLTRLVDDFERNFGKDAQVTHATGVVRAWREQAARDGVEVPEDIDAFLAARPDVPPATQPHTTRENFFAARDASFPAFAASRHVVRHFAGPVAAETIEKAVALAMTAPSACNRQPTRVHVVEDPSLRDRLLELQGGARGFGSSADKLLVVTSDLSSLRWAWERHDCYTNGGIFVMNLCYALHYHGVAHCILHWSVSPDADVAAHGLLGIPASEAIVLLLACGIPPEEFDVASSPRMSLGETLVWHERKKEQ